MCLDRTLKMLIGLILKKNLPVVRKEAKSRSLVKQTPLQRYLFEISKHPLLTPEEEYKLAVEQHDQGDVQAAHRLVTSNLRLVVKIANEFRQAQLSTLDLIQEGNFGLMKAVKKFNPYKGVKLSSYAAWWIRAYILKFIMDNKSQVKMGTTAAQRKLFYNLEKVRQKLLTEFDTVDSKLIADTLNVKEKDVIEMQKRLGGGDTSLDGEREGGVAPIEILESDAEMVDEQLAREEIQGIFLNQLNDFHQSLVGRDREIFEQRLLAENPKTLKEIGDQYGISRERARQLEAKILKNLKGFVQDLGTLDAEVVR